MSPDPARPGEEIDAAPIPSAFLKFPPSPDFKIESLELPKRWGSVGKPFTKGGSSLLYEISDLFDDDAKAVLKILKPEKRNNPLYQAFLKRDAKTLVRLANREVGSVPVCYDMGNHPELGPWFIMSCIQGETLSAQIKAPDKERGRIWLKDALDSLTKTAMTVAAAHEAGVVHLDLKPPNIIRSFRGNTSVVDWGFSHELAECGTQLIPGSPVSTLGSVGYMSPEILRRLGRDKIGPQADVFALGAILCTILFSRYVTGHPLSQFITKKQLWNRYLENIGEFNESMPKILRQGYLWWVPNDVYGELVKICQKATRLDPSKRMSSAGEFAGELMRFNWTSKSDK